MPLKRNRNLILFNYKFPKNSIEMLEQIQNTILLSIAVVLHIVKLDIKDNWGLESYSGTSFKWIDGCCW